ncbi:unnamed protein product, partial [marine sediment metagenome]
MIGTYLNWVARLSGGIKKMGSSSFDEGLDKIITNQVNNIDIREDSYQPDINKFTDYLIFCRLYPKGDYLQFK